MANKLHSELMRPFSAAKREQKIGSPEPFQHTRKLGLPPQYLAALALAAPDPEKAHVQRARTMLTTLSQRWRAAASRFKAPRLMPEVQLPWLLHVLAHHPDFKAEEDEAFSSTQKCLDLFLTAVLHGASEFDLLRQMLTGVKVAVDRLAPDEHHVHVVADIAREILQLRGKDRKWTQSIAPQELGLSSALFFRPSERSNDHIVDYLPANFKMIGSMSSSKVRGNTFSDGGAALKKRGLLKQEASASQVEPRKNEKRQRSRKALASVPNSSM